MLYKNGKKFIFVHIPKNAGNTVRQSILNLPNDDVKLVSHVENGVEYRSIVNEHLTYDEYLKKYSTYNPENFFSFCFIRNPYIRFISIFNYLADERFLNSGSYVRKKTAELFLNFKNPLDTLIFLTTNVDNEFFRDRHGYSQVDYIGSTKKIDFIGVVENFNTDMGTILNTIKLNPVENFSNLNMSSGNFLELLTDNSYINLVNKIYGRDIELYKTVLKARNLHHMEI